MMHKYILLLSLTGCSKVCDATYLYQNQTNYKVTATQTTANGIKVDSSGQAINLSKIDRLTDEVERCLIAQFGNPPIVPPIVVMQGLCQSNTFDLPIKRACLTVKVPSDWFISQYEYGGSKHQLLPYPAPEQGCLDKGLPAGNCYWRAGIQNNLTIVVPPSFYLYKDPLIRIVTGCNNPWGSPPLAVCANPSTMPLDNGTEN
jgi:hypothetical protein